MKHSKIENFVLTGKRKRNQTSSHAAAPSHQVKGTKRVKKVTFNVQDKTTLKKKKPTTTKPTSRQGFIHSKKELRKSVHSDNRHERIAGSQSDIFVGDQKVTLGSVKDWDDKDSEHPRMAKIRKNNELVCRKNVKGKKLSVWVIRMKKSKENKCVIKSKWLDDDCIADVSNLFCEDNAKKKSNVNKSTSKESRTTRKNKNINMKKKLRVWKHVWKK